MSAPTKTSAFRGDLEGIRGIALVIILFTHLIEWPTGGFVALDIFFVLSGYLITGLLLREYRLTGTISLNGFYRRRVRRLMPSAMLVLVVTCLTALFVFITSRALSTLWDAFWSILLVSNWNFALNGTDYFATSLPQSPLLHFWSLSVEEQFYLFWPAIVLGLLLLGAGARGARRARRATQSLRPMVVGIAVIGLLSFIWGVVQADLNPQVSYLSTLTRIWELSAGALLCFVTPLAQRIPQLARPVLAWTGFAAILISAFVYTPALHYPGYWCLVPVASTVLIIVAGIGGPSHLVVTTNPVARYLGKISYTGYLWHWPIFIFFGVLFGRESLVYLFVAMPLSLVVAALTTRFIEDPIRHSKWLEPRSHRSRRAHPRQRAEQVRIGFISTGVAVAIALIAVIALAPRSQVESLPVASDPVASVIDPGGVTSTTPATDAPTTSIGTEQKRLSDAITVGLDTADWPADLNPGLDNLGMDAFAPQWTKDGCLDVSDANIDSCIYGDATLPKTAVLLGDSAVISYMPGLEPALNSMGYRIQVLTHAQCSFANVQVLGQSADGQAAPGFPGVCDSDRQWSIDRALELKPDLVVVTDAESEVTAMVITGDDQRFAAMETGLTDSLTKLSPIGAPIVVLAGPPQTVVLSACATRLNHPSDCVKPVSNTWLKLLKVQQDAAQAVSATSTQPVQVVDTSAWYCSAKGACPTFAGLTTMRADSLHLTAVYAASLQPILQLTLEGLLPAPAA